MMINTGMRTDIPAFYSKWLANRIGEGYVLVRNPYFPEQVTRYRLSPDVVDVLVFCTKNPAPMFERMDVLGPFRQFWFVTITPYGKDIEPNVPDWEEAAESFRRLSGQVGSRAMSWRYDPVFVSEKYDLDFHKMMFERMAERLEGTTEQAVISFIDLYDKTRRNFPEARTVSAEERAVLAESFARSGKQHGMTVRGCCEGTGLARYGLDVGGCITKEILERAIGEELAVPKPASLRASCSCVFGNDIGVYNTCRHFCKYCYANYDKKTVLDNQQMHDPSSPFMIGSYREGDRISDAKQKSYRTGQMRLEW